MELNAIFKRTPTKFSGDIEHGVAFVTTFMQGAIYAGESKQFRASIASKIAEGTESVEVKAGVNIVDSSAVTSLGSGTVGVNGIYIQLLKTKDCPDIRIKNIFYVRKNRDERLKYVLGSMCVGKWRRFLGKEAPYLRGVVMSESYFVKRQLRGRYE